MFRVLFSGFLPLILFSQSCGNSDRPNNLSILDSLKKDTLAPLVLRSQIIRSGSKDSVSLDTGEWYAVATFLEFNNLNNTLYFQNRDGDTLKTLSNAWDRSGRMQLADDNFIYLKKGKNYELIYYYQFKPGKASQIDPNGFKLSDIIHWGSYFHDQYRYSANKGNCELTLPSHAAGRFLGSMEDGWFRIVLAGKSIRLFCSRGNRDESELKCIPITASTVQFPESDGSMSYFHYDDDSWVKIDEEGNKTQYFPEKIFQSSNN